MTPPELAKESDEDVGVLPIESAVKPSDEVEDLSNVRRDQRVALEDPLSRLPEHALVAREQALSVEHQMTLFRRMLCVTFAMGSNFTPSGSGAIGLKVPNQTCHRLKFLLPNLSWIM